MVKNLPALQETQVQSLGQEDPLEKEIPTSVFLPGESHGQRSLPGYNPWGHKNSDTTECNITHTLTYKHTHTYTHTCIYIHTYIYTLTHIYIYAHVQAYIDLQIKYMN